MGLAGRRDFLNRGLALLSFAALSPEQLFASESESFETGVSFERAVKDKNLRQACLDGVVKDLFEDRPEYSMLSGVFYDDDRALANGKYLELFLAASRRPKNLENLRKTLTLSENMDSAVKFMMKKGAFSELRGGGRYSAIQSFLKSDGGLSQYSELLVRHFIPDLTRHMQSAVAETIADSNTGDIGIYANSRLFEGIRIPSWGITVAPSREILEMVLVHEFAHVELAVNWLDFNGKKMPLFGEDVQIPELVVDFVAECRGYTAGLVYARKFNSVSPPGMDYHPAYLVAAGMMRDYWFTNQMPIYSTFGPGAGDLWGFLSNEYDGLLEQEFQKHMSFYDEISAAYSYALKHKSLLKKR